MFVTPIRLDLPLETNQISCCKGKWYVRRFDPDTVENGHIYSSIKEEEVFIYWAYLTFSVGQAEDFVGRFDNHQQLDFVKGEHFPLCKVLN